MSPSFKPVIALIDDDAIFQLTASRMLRATDIPHDILQFSNGEEGLRYLNEHADDAGKLPDLIFLDINMPLVDGWMFLDDYRNLRSTLSKAISIYMVSSSIDPQDVNRARGNSLVKDYLVKPIAKETFASLLKSVVHSLPDNR